MPLVMPLESRIQATISSSILRDILNGKAVVNKMLPKGKNCVSNKNHPFFPPPVPAAGFSNGFYPQSKFLAV
jgi:hypothetical protein